MREALWNLHMLCALEEQEVRLKYNVKFEHMMRKKRYSRIMNGCYIHM